MIRFRISRVKQLICELPHNPYHSARQSVVAELKSVSMCGGTQDLALYMNFGTVSPAPATVNNGLDPF
jgi:hypothetical protein